ncbi:ribonuclease HII [Helicobacter cappadocius]|uniref:Ribonuclease HII n=1 Tax=Helicobacter cappadocius TaxID=3063998 RepID=A0AA90TA15_9HELI|nr:MULTISPECIES: ribonuclease HII [unclassified Helicobacter]MDO7253525.1 ribonuclease HII [Helicobacter sp. faydin-H75]MDP2539452.1 ribonuclease HII [Helicobacter sp. faydin-H76]
MICGIDEAGRGCLCGSMFVAGLVCDESKSLWLKEIGVKDSKKISKKKRFQLAELILEEKQIKSCIIKKTSHDIDQRGLSCCLKESIEEIIATLLPFTKRFYLDGNTIFGIPKNERYILEAIIKGDDKIIQISAASVLAKASKDNEMLELDEKYPEYDFRNNSGYGTLKHLQSIEIFGQTPFHRKSFMIKKSSF